MRKMFNRWVSNLEEEMSEANPLAILYAVIFCIVLFLSALVFSVAYPMFAALGLVVFIVWYTYILVKDSK